MTLSFAFDVLYVMYVYEQNHMLDLASLRSDGLA